MNCLICGESLGDCAAKIGNAGLATLLRSSEIRRDGKAETFRDTENLRLHPHCRKEYTRSTALEKIQKQFEEDDDVKGAGEQGSSAAAALRSQQKSDIDFKSQCFICADPCSQEVERRKAKEYRRSVHMCTEIPLIEEIRKVALARKDEIGQTVYVRLAVALDLVQTDARYHHDCYVNFKKPPTKKDVGRPLDDERSKAFLRVCQYLEDNDECQYSITEVTDLMQSFLSETNELCYTRRYMKLKLAEHFQDRVVFTDLPGRGTYLCFRETSDRLIHDAWYSDRKKNKEDEKVRFIEAVVSILSEEIRSQAYDLETFAHDGSDIYDQSRIPPLLKLFVDRLTMPKKDSDIARRRRQAVCDMLITACRPRSFVSPILLSLGTYLHRHYESRNLIDILHSLGLSVSYSEVRRVEHSLMVASELKENVNDAVVQFAFDNADVNVKTLDGHGTFHCLGGLMIHQPRKEVESGTMPIRVQRLKTFAKSKDISGWMDVTPYEKPARRGLAEVTVKDVNAVTFTDKTALAFSSFRMDAFWMSSYFLSDSPTPNWNGYMETAMKGYADYEVCGETILPFINLDANNPTSIYTALQYVASECKRLNQPFSFVTFDLPPFNKAMEIVLSDGPNGEISKKIVVKLGPFHLMMSFMGAISAIMPCSGLTDAIETVYAKNSVKQMMSGHAYSRALRAHFLVQLSLCLILLRDVPMMKSDAVKQELRDMHRRLLSNEVSFDEISNNPLLKLLADELIALMEKTSKGRTGALWVQYIKCVELLRLFLRAERTGDWSLHLACIKEMLPIFCAAGHLPYAKGARLYMQQMETLTERFSPDDVQKIIQKSTIRRFDKFWSGVSPDLACEQDVMRPMKISGGLVRGRGITDDSLALWIWGMPRCAPMCDTLELFCGVRSTSSHQHIEMGVSRQSHDWRDVGKFTEWFDAHPPFAERPPSELVSLSTGLVADATVNCDKAFEVGLKSLKAGNGKKFSDLKMKRSEKVKTFASMLNTVLVNNKRVDINPEQFFHRIIFVCTTDEEKRDAFSRELSSQPTSLFDKGLMRKTAKSSLQEVFAERCPSESALPRNTQYVLDGGNLLHTLSKWPKDKTFGELCLQYTAYVTKHYGSQCHVVFDGYRGAPSPKGQEQEKRGRIEGSVLVEVQPQLPVIVSSSSFLGNSENKAQLIDLLVVHLRAAGVTTYQAEGDADVLIVEVALKLYMRNKAVTIVAKDTDILVIALVRSVKKQCLYVHSPGTATQAAKVFNVTNLQAALGKSLVDCLPFVYAFTGCDTTSAIFNKGKKSAIDIIESTPAIRSQVSVFMQKNVSKDRIAAAGEAFFVELYRPKHLKGAVNGLNDLRFKLYSYTVSQQNLSARFKLASLPPTSDAARQHSLRVYYQVQHWLGNTLVATDWGWRLDGQRLIPVAMEELPAPDALMRLIACQCKQNCTASCGCRKKNLDCSLMCKNCQGEDCDNRRQKVPQTTEDDEEAIDDPDPQG